MIRSICYIAAPLAGLLLLGGAVRSSGVFEGPVATSTETPATAAEASAKPLAPSALPPPATAPSPPTPREALANGVLIVVSKHSQRMFVFKDGQPWASSPVSTGRPGNDTPAGVFPILQKRVRHRSSLYAGASMPYMQRLTWDGVALHAGRLPGFRASHGCIRLPAAFARRLYAITSFRSTAVLIVEEMLATSAQALGRVSGEEPTLVRNSQRPPSPARALASNGQVQTIQVAAVSSAASAAALWQQLIQRRPELAALHQQIVPATVQAREVFRLRASGSDAHAICGGLASAGIACLKIGAGRTI